MAERVPAITLTDPHNRDTPPSPAQSPARDNHGADYLDARLESVGRPGSRASSSTSHSGCTSAHNQFQDGTAGRPDSPGSWHSPSRLVRRPSNNGSTASSALRRDEGSDGGRKHDTQPAMDPLSQHILQRTHMPMPPPITNRPTTPERTAPKDDRSPIASAAAPAVQDPIPLTRLDASNGSQRQKDLKKGIKAVSFLGRLMGAKKKDVEGVVVEDDIESNDGRPEGNDAAVFAQSVDNMGYNPRHLQPPAYIKVRAKNKKQLEFDRLFLAQELSCKKRRKDEVPSGSNKLRRKSSTTPGASTVWAMEFSKDGKHLAAAGVDTVVRVWAVLSSQEDRRAHEQQESRESEGAANGMNGRAEHLNAPVFQSKPVREYEGHTATVLDLSWSKNNFLLSSSMDKTVRLWHTSRAECLCTFKHNDFVPSISFHPKDDRFFLAGSLDCRLRLWSIPDKSVAYSARIPEMITAVAFTPDGKYCIAGCLNGLCMFYETEGLKYQTQTHVRSTRGHNAKGSKITGIQAYHSPGSLDVKVLITSNDSRVRLYNYRDKSLELKLKGNSNNSSQIRAAISDDGRYVVCGSEDRKAYIWSIESPADGDKREKRPVEMFEAHDTITTAVCFAPATTRRLLSKSEDPLYDLCNPPPVTLMSRAERAESLSSSKPPTESGSVIIHAPADAQSEKAAATSSSPAYLARSNHREGNIIVTADFMGTIKVFRQDCAWSKRKADDQWDKASLRTKRSGGKASSIMTMASQRSLRHSGEVHSDRILSWRQGIASTPAIARRSSSTKHTSRSISPRKSVDQLGRSVPAGSIKSSHPLSEEVSVYANGKENGLQQPTTAPSPSSAQSTASKGDGGGNVPSNPHNGPPSFWDTSEWKKEADRLHTTQQQNGSSRQPLGRLTSDAEHLSARPELASGHSYVSLLSDERTSDGSDDDDDVFNDARETRESDSRL